MDIHWKHTDADDSSKVTAASFPQLVTYQRIKTSESTAMKKNNNNTLMLLEQKTWSRPSSHE